MWKGKNHWYIFITQENFLEHQKKGKSQISWNKNILDCPNTLKTNSTPLQLKNFTLWARIGYSTLYGPTQSVKFGLKFSF